MPEGALRNIATVNQDIDRDRSNCEHNMRVFLFTELDLMLTRVKISTFDENGNRRRERTNARTAYDALSHSAALQLPTGQEQEIKDLLAMVKSDLQSLGELF